MCKTHADLKNSCDILCPTCVAKSRSVYHGLCPVIWNSGFPSARVNLSPFTKDFRGMSLKTNFSSPCLSPGLLAKRKKTFQQTKQYPLKVVCDGQPYGYSKTRFIFKKQRLATSLSWSIDQYVLLARFSSLIWGQEIGVNNSFIRSPVGFVLPL